MHACLPHIYEYALLYLFLFVVYHKKSIMVMHVQRYLNKDRSFVMLTSSIRLCSVLYPNDSE
jgi:hypothetical protein